MGVGENENWLSVSEAAAQLGLTKETVARLAHRGVIKIDRPRPRLTRIRQSDLDAYVESSRIKPGTLGSYNGAKKSRTTKPDTDGQDPAP